MKQAVKLLSKATFSISKKMPYADGNPVLPNTLTVKYGKTLTHYTGEFQKKKDNENEGNKKKNHVQ